jgi:hypothetical protein
VRALHPHVPDDGPPRAPSGMRSRVERPAEECPPRALVAEDQGRWLQGGTAPVGFHTPGFVLWERWVGHDDSSQKPPACPVFPQGVRTYRLSQLPDNSG